MQKADINWVFDILADLSEACKSSGSYELSERLNDIIIELSSRKEMKESNYIEIIHTILQ